MTERKNSRGKIIFDMDGVITGEDCYWSAASLAVWELLYSKSYLGLTAEGNIPPFKTELTFEEVASIRRIIFQDDKVISFLKRQAVNSNWDLAFLTFGYQLVLFIKTLEARGTGQTALEEVIEALERGQLSPLSPFIFFRGRWRPSFDAILGHWTAEARGEELMQLLAARLPRSLRDRGKKIFAPFSPLWEKVREVFQEWYLGEEKYREFYRREPAAPGKRGLILEEKTILPVEKIKKTLEELLIKGWMLGIATGRPFNELYPPLESMGIWDLFDGDSIATFDDVQKAEQALKAEGYNVFLGKPHPFTFLKAYWGAAVKEKELLFPTLKRPEPKSCWVVGDSLADLLAAREMGAFFIGVLTGHSGVNSKNLLEQEGARFVLPDITFIPLYLS